MSEWEDYCIANGWNVGSEEDYDRFLDSLETDKGKTKYTSNKRDARGGLRFDDFSIASKWARQIPGLKIARSVNGWQFVPKGINKVIHKNRFSDKDSGEATLLFEELISKLSHHLHQLYTTTVHSSFNAALFESDLDALESSKLIELANLLEDYIEYRIAELAQLKAYLKSSLRNPEEFGWSQDVQWVTDLEDALSFCVLRLSASGAISEENNN